MRKHTYYILLVAVIFIRGGEFSVVAKEKNTLPSVKKIIDQVVLPEELKNPFSTAIEKNRSHVGTIRQEEDSLTARIRERSKLTAIVYSKENPKESRAIISGKIFKVGETIGEISFDQGIKNTVVLKDVRKDEVEVQLYYNAKIRGATVVIPMKKEREKNRIKY